MRMTFRRYWHWAEFVGCFTPPFQDLLPTHCLYSGSALVITYFREREEILAKNSALQEVHLTLLGKGCRVEDVTKSN